MGLVLCRGDTGEGVGGGHGEAGFEGGRARGLHGAVRRRCADDPVVGLAGGESAVEGPGGGGEVGTLGDELEGVVV